MKKRCLTEEEIRAIGISDPQENREIHLALLIGRKFGYGNVIAFLATEWALRLREEGLDEATAIAHVSNRSPYPLPK